MKVSFSTKHFNFLIEHVEVCKKKWLVNNMIDILWHIDFENSLDLVYFRKACDASIVQQQNISCTKYMEISFQFVSISNIWALCALYCTVLQVYLIWRQYYLTTLKLWPPTQHTATCLRFYMMKTNVL